MRTINKTKFISSKLVTLLVLCSTILSCKKEKVEENIITATINISEPTINDTIAYNEELHVEGTISGNADLHGYEIKIVNLNTNEELLSTEFHEHQSAYNFHEHWVNNVNEITNVKVKIEVEKDHDGNKEEKEVNVICLPQ